MRDNCIFCRKSITSCFPLARSCSNNLNHTFYIEISGYQELIIYPKKYKPEYIAFNNDVNRSLFYTKIIFISDFSILENKSMDELIDIYNKIRAFK